MKIHNVYTLPSIDCVGGSSVKLHFNTYWGDNRRPISMLDCTANFAMVSYVNQTGAPVVSKKMSVTMNDAQTEHNVLFVELEPADTLDLSGKYIYQITVRDIGGDTDIPQQGIIYVHNNINPAYLRD